MNHPYRSNSNAPPTTVNGHKVEVMTKEVFDVEALITYQGPDNKSLTATMIFEADQEDGQVRDRRNEPSPHEIQCGTSMYTESIEYAAKHNHVWVNKGLCIPWHRIFSTEIVKKVSRTVRYYYFLSNM